MVRTRPLNNGLVPVVGPSIRRFTTATVDGVIGSVARDEIVTDASVSHRAKRVLSAAEIIVGYVKQMGWDL